MTVCGGNAAFFERVNMDVAVCQQRICKIYFQMTGGNISIPYCNPQLRDTQDRPAGRFNVTSRVLSKMAFVSPYFSGDQQVAGITLSVVEQADQQHAAAACEILKDF